MSITFKNWNEFYELMSIIRAKTICEKVDLFIKVADEDGNGLLSWNEIIKLCKISLMR
jgi:Ca2+-binding EF-hand superfamily protein